MILFFGVFCGIVFCGLGAGFVWMCYADTKRSGYDPHGGNPLT